jgi:type IV pilus assembly protein PilC
MDYAYLGYTEDRQIVKGTISAATEQMAIDMLANVGYRVVNLKPITTFLPSLGKLFQARIKPSEMITFSRQLALLLESGVGIVRSLELLQSQATDKGLRKVLAEIISDLRRGESFSASLAKHPHVFSTLYCKMVNVGEQTGALETVLRNLATHTERQAATMAKLKQALTYPIIVFCLGIVVAAVMITVLLPPLVTMFSRLGGELPITTRALLASFDLLHSYGFPLLVTVITLGVVGFMYARTPKGRYYRDLLILKLPVFGRLGLISELARCCRSLSLLISAGLPLPEIMTLTSQASGNRVVAKALSEVEQDMLKGEGLAEPMRKRHVFLPLMVEMTKVGEETGNLDQTLITVAENYEIEADRRTQTMLSMIEPVMTIAMGLGVGFLALSIVMPIYSSLSLVGG